MELVIQATDTRAVSRAALWTGRILSGIAVLFMLFSASMKLFVLDPAVESFAQLGYPTGVTFGIGVLELGCTLAYLWPRTAVYGAILLTGYLGGAVATHLRLLDPWLSHTLFPLYVGALVWGGLALRDRGLRVLLTAPLRAAPGSACRRP
jgi:hypothetical protein